MSLTDAQRTARTPNTRNALHGVLSAASTAALLLLWALILVAGTAVYLLHHDGRAAARYLERAIAGEVPGLSCTVRSVEPVFRGGPGLRLTEVLLRDDKGGVLYADACDLTPSPTALLRGRLALGSLTLHNPLIRTGNPFSIGTPHEAAVSTPVLHDLAVPPELAGARLAIRNGTLILPCRDAEIVASGLSFDLTLPFSGDDHGVGFPNAAVYAESLEYVSAAGNGSREQAGSPLALRRLHLKATDCSLSETGIPLGKFDLEGEGRIQETACDFRLNFMLYLKNDGAAPGLDGRLDVRGFSPLRPDASKSALSKAVLGKGESMFDLSAVFTSDDVRKSVDLQNAVVHVPNRTRRHNDPNLATPEEDGAALKGRITLQPVPRFQGTLRIRRFSPALWLDAVQDMPAGLRQVLDRLQGELDVVLTPDRLEIPALHIDAAGTRFQGTGGIADFRQPVFRLEAKTSKFRLDPLFSAPASVPPADARPTPASSESGIDMGCDIRLSADTVEFRGISGSGLDVGLQSRSGGARLNASLKRLYGGTIKANLNLGQTAEIDFRVAGVQTDKLIRAASGSDLVSGRLDAEGSLRIPGTDGSRSSAGVSGTVRIGLRDGTYRFGDTTEGFSRLELRFAGRCTQTGHGRESRLIGDGLWHVALRRPKLDIHLDLDGPVRLSPALVPVRIGTAAVKAGGTVADTGTELKGILEYDAAERRLRLTEIKGRWGGLTLSGRLTGLGLGRDPVWQGECNAQTSNLHPLLRLVNLLPDGTGSDVLRKAAVKTRFVVSRTELHLEDLSGNLDDTVFRGTLKRRTATPPSWEIDLNVGELNMDRYLPQKTQSAPDAPWPAHALEAFNLKGRAAVEALTVSGVTLHRIELPVRVHQGLLTVDPVSARVCNGEAGARLRCRRSDGGFAVRLVCALRNADMHRLTSAQGEGSTVLFGKGSLDADIQGTLRSPADIPGRLNGSWSMKIDKGHVAEKGGSRRFFNRIAASGTLRSGVLHSDDLHVSGSDFTLRGKGHVNLVNRSLGYDLLVSAMGLRDIPVRYSGSLNAPQRRISAVGIVTGTLGLVGRGVLGLVDGVFAAPRRLVRR